MGIRIMFVATVIGIAVISGVLSSLTTARPHQGKDAHEREEIPGDPHPSDHQAS